MTDDQDEFIETISQLPGVGDAKAEALWDAGYRSIDEVRESSAEELADDVDGVGPKLADAILQGIADLETEEPEPEVEIVEETDEEEAEPEEAAEIVEEDEHIPKPKPDLDEATERALEIRKRIKDAQPRFVRRNWWQFPRFDKDHSWRKPRGTHSKMREDRKHAPKRVKVGYRGPKEARGLHPSGFEDVLVHNTDDLEDLDPDTEAARIASGVGKRKKIKIVEQANELGIHVLNPGEVSK
jgi:large subunit ribosomal protein L32e